MNPPCATARLRRLFTRRAAVIATGILLAGCGIQNSNDAPATDDPTSHDAYTPVACQNWSRTDYGLTAEDRASTPAGAVHAITETAVVQETTQIDGESVSVQVVTDGETGTYGVEKLGEEWVVLSGEGCGAPAPDPLPGGELTDMTDCATVTAGSLESAICTHADELEAED